MTEQWDDLLLTIYVAPRGVAIVDSLTDLVPNQLLLCVVGSDVHKS